MSIEFLELLSQNSNHSVWKINYSPSKIVKNDVNIAKMLPQLSSTLKYEYLVGLQINKFIEHYEEGIHFVKTVDLLDVSFDENFQVLIQDFVKGEKLSNCWESLNISDIISILLQCICAINKAQQEIEFTHYDLHVGNIIVKKLLSSKIFSYNIDGEIITFESNYQGVIIDYGLSHVSNVSNAHLQTSANISTISYGVVPSIFDQQYDICFLITQFIKILENKKFQDCEKIKRWVEVNLLNPNNFTVFNSKYPGRDILIEPLLIDEQLNFNTTRVQYPYIPISKISTPLNWDLKINCSSKTLMEQCNQYKEECIEHFVTKHPLVKSENFLESLMWDRIRKKLDIDTSDIFEEFLQKYQSLFLNSLYKHKLENIKNRNQYIFIDIINYFKKYLITITRLQIL